MNQNDLELLRSLSPCEEGFKFAKGCESLHDVFETCERGDWLMWLLRRTKKIEKKHFVMIAIACAERCLDRFEKKYPNDDRPRKAIESAKKWVKKSTKRNAAAAAASASAYAAASARNNERKCLADIVRKVVKNPFKRPV